MKKQVLYMFFVILFSNVCKSMFNNLEEWVLYILRDGREPSSYQFKMQLPSKEIIVQKLHARIGDNLENNNIYTTLSQKLGDKYTSIRAIRECSEYTIQNDSIGKAFSVDEKEVLLQKITDTIVSIGVPDSTSSSSSSSLSSSSSKFCSVKQKSISSSSSSSTTSSAD